MYDYILMLFAAYFSVIDDADIRYTSLKLRMMVNC